MNPVDESDKEGKPAPTIQKPGSHRDSGGPRLGADGENGTLQWELEQERKRHKEGMAALQAE
jgi:hypothetical protein